MIQELSDYLHVSPDFMTKLIPSVLIIVVLWIMNRVGCSLIHKKVLDTKRAYHLRRTVKYTSTFLAICLIGPLWIKGIESIATFLGLASAGLAVAMHDTIANVTGWIFIMWRRPFVLGDRIQIGDTSGDVIDIGVLQFSMIEIANWVDADQSTGRIVHIPNSKVLREGLANYHTGFEYVWHEIPVLVTFESDWKKAKAILTEIAEQRAEHLTGDAEKQIRRAAVQYLVQFKKLTPIVYTTVRDSGVLLTVRYFVKPRQRRSSEQDVWEAILDEFAKHDDISLAYPTTRFYCPERHRPISGSS
ncbi:MAG: mechanosensitive ion channel family protein [Candidatus Hydrogenedentes bacterium]|nr:mechanosensitive ion channel family protein [Candidatus Hydrogenedentota bacterium]